jgi:2,4-dienoyl-CoA reductase-like NADH-dependent reductase (Old Yellow Enzyme family)
MCQYSCVNRDGMATPWHTVHLGGFAVGGAGLVFSEATAVEARGRISPEDLGIWDDAHVEPLAGITRFIRDQGAVPGVQLAHAGRKASVFRPWDGGGSVALDQGGWETVGPSAIPFADNYRAPRALSTEEIGQIRTAFVQAVDRALAAGFQTVEIHAAHGYLLHEFLSPVSNHRTDAYGGSFENRIRLVLEVVRAVRQRWPEELPLFVRVSATDWLEDEPDIASWTLEQTVELARVLRDEGVDVLDCSSGGNVARAHVPAGPGYQTAFAERVRRESGLATMAVGMITEPAQADHIVRSGQADLVALARAFLREPHWAFLAAQELGQPQPWPPQYLRARLR